MTHKAMHESVLRDYFLGIVSAAELENDIAGSEQQLSDIASEQHIEDMSERFNVRRTMLVQLCDDVLVKKIRPESLHLIGFALLASERFEFDASEDELMVDVINDWSCPEVNWPLTINSVQMFRRWLLNEEPYPEKPGSKRALSNSVRLNKKREQTVISIRKKN
jgi:hypothetical protein